MTGFFQRLFSKRQAAQETSSPPLAGRLEIEEFGHNLVSIDALDFIGQQAISPNQRYRLIWADRAPDGPNVREHHVTGLFDALGPDRLAEIATVFATAPYDLRAGWPDLTLWPDGKVKFVEVK